MKTESTFNRESNITLWIKKTCRTIDYIGEGGYIEDLTYLSSYLICQMRENDFATPPDRETAILFILRDLEGITECITNMIPNETLNQVAISLPETREFIILNGTELDSPYTYNKFKGFAFLPSGMIDSLPKKTELITPSINKIWPEMWKLIKESTSEIARKIFCVSFATTNPGCDDDETNLKALVDIKPINKSAILNLMDSSETVNCSDDDTHEKWILKPEPD